MNKQEILNYLAEKKRVTASVAAAENRERKARMNYEKAVRKWRVGIVILLILTVAYIWFCFTGDLGLFYIDGNGMPQAGGIGGLLLFGGLSVLLLYIKINRYVKPADSEWAAARNNLQKARTNPEYQNGVRDFPAKFYNYYDISRLWNFINEGRAASLKEAYNLLETQQFQQDQMAIQEDIRCLNQEIAAASKVNAAASVITAYNTAKRK